MIDSFRSSDTLILMLLWFDFSAVFNIFGVISVCGLFAGKKITLEWYPITRDCVVYGITVLLLIIVLLDEKVRNETFETLIKFVSLIQIDMFLTSTIYMLISGVLVREHNLDFLLLSLHRNYVLQH